MRRAIYIVNLVLVIASAVGAITIYFGLLGMLALGIIQPICAIIYWAQWRELSARAKFHLKIYLYFLAFCILCMLGVYVGSEMNVSYQDPVETILGIFALGGCTAMAIYFTFIAYVLSKEVSKRKFVETDTDILDADLIEEA